MKIAALYEAVTQSIISQLEQGTAPWVKPWKGGKSIGIMPANAITGHHYRGVNVPILWHAADVNCYPNHAWLTFKQALDKGGSVRKGEKATHIVFTKRIKVEDDDDEREISMLKAFAVFNVAQVDGLEIEQGTPEPPPAGAVEAFVAATGADIRHGGDRACFIPSHDFIALPNPSAFESQQHYDATKLHELCHWSGGKVRLNRDLSGRFGTSSYAAEELIAELGAAFLCAHLGVTGKLRHADYVASWIKLLKDDDRAIFTASSKASQAADYLRSYSEQAKEAA